VRRGSWREKAACDSARSGSDREKILTDLGFVLGLMWAVRLCFTKRKLYWTSASYWASLSCDRFRAACPRVRAGLMTRWRRSMAAVVVERGSGEGDTMQWWGHCRVAG
jgi:hypothetical protein